MLKWDLVPASAAAAVAISQAASVRLWPQDEDLVLEGLERRQDGAELEAVRGARGPEGTLVHAVRGVDEHRKFRLRAGLSAGCAFEELQSRQSERSAAEQLDEVPPAQTLVNRQLHCGTPSDKRKRNESVFAIETTRASRSPVGTKPFFKPSTEQASSLAATR